MKRTLKSVQQILSHSFPVQNGLREGVVSAPLLFRKLSGTEIECDTSAFLQFDDVDLSGDNIYMQ
jgi:hypothetical protein